MLLLLLGSSSTEQEKLDIKETHTCAREGGEKPGEKKNENCTKKPCFFKQE